MSEVKEYIFVENGLALEDYIRLKEEAFGGSCPKETSRASLNGSAYILHVEVEGETIGMARIISDGGFVNFLADMIVTPSYQGMGIGRAIMERMIAYVKSNIPNGGRTKITLEAAKGKEGFYRKFGFRSRSDRAKGHSMSLYLSNSD